MNMEQSTTIKKIYHEMDQALYKKKYNVKFNHIQIENLINLCSDQMQMWNKKNEVRYVFFEDIKKTLEYAPEV